MANLTLQIIVAAAVSLLCVPGRGQSLSAEQRKATTTAITRPDGSQLIYYFNPPARRPFPVLLYLDGSSCHSVTQVLPFFKPFVDIGLGVMTMEKRGVEPDDDGKICSKEYLETNDRMQRISDAELLIVRLRGLFPDWNGKLIVVGGSEGGTIAPEIALSYDQTVAVVSLASGGWSQSEELKKLKETELSESGKTHEEIQAALAELDAKFEEIRKSPVSSKTWFGDDNTYKRWASYLWYSPLDYFVKLNVPVYIAQGVADKNAPVESADAVRDRFNSLRKTNAIYRRYEGLDHQWIDSNGQDQTGKVIGDLLDWLKPLVGEPSRK